MKDNSTYTLTMGRGLGLALEFALAVASALGAEKPGADQNRKNRTSWKIAGELEEACSCQPPCRQVEGGEHMTSVGDVGAFSGRLLEGGFPGAPQVHNPPLADPTHRQYQQGQATRLTYNDEGQGWQYENSNYMFNRFKIDDKQYEKCEAELARKMSVLQPPATR